MPVAADARGDAMTLSSCAGLLLLEDGRRPVQMAASAVKLSAAKADDPKGTSSARQKRMFPQVRVAEG